jgi:hypothetical protein
MQSAYLARALRAGYQAALPQLWSVSDATSRPASWRRAATDRQIHPEHVRHTRLTRRLRS